MRLLFASLTVAALATATGCSSNPPDASDAGVDAGEQDGGIDAGNDAGSVDLSEPCLWAPLRCASTSGSECDCVRNCDGDAYAMRCSGGACTCEKDGAQTGTASATCGDAFSETDGFSNGCGFPGIVYHPSDGGTPSCAAAQPSSFFVSSGCATAKVCEGHSYAMRCAEGYGCYCATDGVWTGNASASCSSGASLATAYSVDCQYP